MEVRVQRDMPAWVPCGIFGVMLVLVVTALLLDAFSDRGPTRAERVAACNAEGGLYLEGICQKPQGVSCR